MEIKITPIDQAAEEKVAEGRMKVWSEAKRKK